MQEGQVSLLHGLPDKRPVKLSLFFALAFCIQQTLPLLSCDGWCSKVLLDHGKVYKVSRKIVTRNCSRSKIGF